MTCWWRDKRREKSEVPGEKPLWVPLCPHKSHKDWPETEPKSLWWKASDKSRAMAQDTVVFSMTLELCTLKSFVMWHCFMQCTVPDIVKGCSGLKIKRFENRAVHVYRTATLVASLTLWIQPLQASWTTGTTHPSRRHITEFLNLQQQHWDNLTPHIYWFSFFTLPSSGVTSFVGQ
jgi:hypothetical protein